LLPSLCSSLCCLGLSFQLCLLAFHLFLFELLASFHLVHQGLAHSLWKFSETVFAERFALVIVHCTPKRFIASVACEASRMPQLANGTNTIVFDNLLATGANLTEHLVVVELAIRLSVVLEVFTLDKGLATH